MEIDDRAEWRARAMEDPALAASVLLSIRDAAAPPTMELPAPGWGSYGKRSRGVAPRDGGKGRDPAAGGGNARASPMTPLDFSGGSAASESGGEDAVGGSASGGDAAACGVGDRETKVAVGAASALRIPDPRPNRRLAKKKTIPELQAMERSLLEQRESLAKEVEARRRVRVAHVEENRRLKRLKLSMELQQSTPSTPTPSPKEPPRAQLHLASPLVSLPDLNIPLVEESN